MSELYKKMIDEAMAAQRADVGMVKKKRGQAFEIDDAKVYLDAVKKMKPIGDQSKAVFLLHTESVKAQISNPLKGSQRPSAGKTTPLLSTTRHLL